jgi:hypothetical protein
VVTVIDTRRHNSGETPGGQRKKKKMEKREREDKKGTAYGMV